MKFKLKFLSFFLFLCFIPTPITVAIPVIEAFSDGTSISSDFLPEEILDASNNGEIELLVWYTNPNSSLHISAATERATDLNAENGDIFIQGTRWNNSNQNFPNNIESMDLTVNVNQEINGYLKLQANTTLEEELPQTVVLQWLLLKKSTPISDHPIGPTDSRIVSYHAWDSNMNRTEGAENNWSHQIELESLKDWNIDNEDLIAVASLVSLNSNEIYGSGSNEFSLIQIENNSKNYAISILVLFSGIIASIVVISTERKRQKDMPQIRPIVKLSKKMKSNNERQDFFIGITTGNAAIRNISIEGNGFWKHSANDIPLEIPANNNLEIKIRQSSKDRFGPCTIRLEVDGHKRWILDIVFPENDLKERMDLVDR